MTETKNFALKLPEPTDMVDIEVLNENFEKIDEELDPFYVLDLRDIITFDTVNNDREDFDLSGGFAETVDIASLCNAVKGGKNVRLHVKTAETGLDGNTFDVSVLLDNRKTLDETVYLDGPLYGGVLGVTDTRYKVELYISPENQVSLRYSASSSGQGSGESYFDLDLRETVTMNLADAVYDRKVLTAENTDLDALRIAADAGQNIRIQFKLNYGVTVDANVILTSKGTSFSDNGETLNINYNGYISDVLLGSTVYVVGLLLDYYNDLISLSVTSRVNGSTTEPNPTNTTVVKSDSTVTITTTLEGDKQSVTTITVDENDYPTKIDTDGTEWPVTWEGF